jgi:hypothetical protein
MALNADTIAALAERLEACQLEVRDTHKITDDFPEMDWARTPTRSRPSCCAASWRAGASSRA